jgi:hypothetical protein
MRYNVYHGIILDLIVNDERMSFWKKFVYAHFKLLPLNKSMEAEDKHDKSQPT